MTNFKKRFLSELQLYCLYTVFLSLIFSTFTIYQRLLLSEYNNNFIHYGYSFIEAMILAKVILIGEYFKLGEGYGKKPLIFPVSHKTVLFCFLVFIFSILEHFLLGLYSGKGLAEVYEAFTSKGINIILAQMLIMVVVFALFFSFLEIGRELGKGQLLYLFFKRNRD